MSQMMDESMEKKRLEMLLLEQEAKNSPPTYEEHTTKRRKYRAKTLSFISFLLFLIGLCCFVLAVQVRLHKKDLSIKISPAIIEYRLKQWLYPGLHYYHIKFNLFHKLRQSPTASPATASTEPSVNIFIKKLYEINENKYMYDNIDNNNNNDIEMSGGSVDSNNIGSDDNVGSGNHNDQNYQFKIKGNRNEIVNKNGDDEQFNRTTNQWSSTSPTSTNTWWTSKQRVRQVDNQLISNIWSQIHELKKKMKKIY